LLPAFFGNTSSCPAPFTLLLFASSWCPDCTPVVPLLSRFYTAANAGEKKIGGVYVSSDRTDDAIRKHASLLPSDFVTVPTLEDRSGLKKLFGACAGSEVSGLPGIQRRFGIPTIIVIETATEKVVSEDGVGDIRSHGEKCVGIWESRAAKGS